MAIYQVNICLERHGAYRDNRVSLSTFDRCHVQTFQLTWRSATSVLYIDFASGTRGACSTSNAFMTWRRQFTLMHTTVNTVQSNLSEFDIQGVGRYLHLPIHLGSSFRQWSVCTMSALCFHTSVNNILLPWTPLSCSLWCYHCVCRMLPYRCEANIRMLGPRSALGCLGSSRDQLCNDLLTDSLTVWHHS